MMDMQSKTNCKSVFKDYTNISVSLNRLWAEVITQLESKKSSEFEQKI